MRVNTPITQKEYVLNEGMTIVSTTDLQGNINYANQYFIEVSGFLETELLGAPQNILRHPDMPASIAMLPRPFIGANTIFIAFRIDT